MNRNPLGTAYGVTLIHQRSVYADCSTLRVVNP